MFAGKHPKEDHIMLDVDGSYHGNSRNVGYGRLIRDINGSCLVSFSGFAGIGTNLLGELQAIIHGLRIAWDKGYRNVSCLYDSLDAIKLIKVNVPLLHIFNSIVVDIQDMLTR
jgi:ribonuclease HI